MKLFIIIFFLTILVFFPKMLAFSHGINKNIDGSVFITGDSRFLVKLVLSPKNIEFVRPNFLIVSIIDTEKAEHFYGNVQLSLISLSTAHEIVKLSKYTFDKGLFKIKPYFKRNGAYQLIIKIKNDEINTNFSFKFEVKDERILPLIVIGSTGIFLIIFLTIFYKLFKRR